MKSPSVSSGMTARSASPGVSAAATSSVVSPKSTSSLEATTTKVSRDESKAASNSRPVSTVPVNGRIGAPGVGIHGRPLSGAQSNPPAYATPMGPPVALTRTAFPIPPAQLVPPLAHHASLPPGIHPQPSPRPAPIPQAPTQQPGFYVPVYPVYAYPVAPPAAQPVAPGPWILGYCPPQGTVHVPTQATITGASGMRHVNW
ncbi:hypothetical protein EDC04DRAFT_2630525 [Pisolithus marmoratus]|nr:hypothetical protein EDC04DRAFT_2630525 [Pisolithus marmoratus]